ncbi:arsenic resistance protein [Chloroflexus sp.]|uniref:arsenic resistance protein n=1 Tax=Chloroflexus sp. TaxID=1904827 RepID=UPI00298EDBD4|nr:arsenic resistance protein [Chloroflexus sp.]MDW8405305.1 arsenic resistance protein [Chloroflexus sp.]
MTIARLERYQALIYLIAIAAGLVIGQRWPALGPIADQALWPLLALLLTVTFLQIPLLHLREALVDRRLVALLLLGNFLILPIVVWLLLHWLPPEAALQLGVALVLLVPCTDWFIAFCHLGGGDTARALAVTPLLLIVQGALLPLYLWLMLDPATLDLIAGLNIWPALLIIFVPLLVAIAGERWLEARPARQIWRQRSAALTVPLLALVVAAIATSQAMAALAALAVLPVVTPAFVAFLLIAALLARLLAWWGRLPARRGRVLLFSFSTRNSFVVLPLALSLPPGWEVAALVIVVQSLVELIGMAVMVWAGTRWVVREQGG